MTIFAPNDEAYYKPKYAKMLKAKSNVYKHVVKHIILEEIPAKAFETDTLVTIGNNTISLVKAYDYDYDAYIIFEGKMIDVISTDLMASNGVIHEISTYIEAPNPPLYNLIETLRDTGNHEIFLSYFELPFKELLETMDANAWTILAPTDDAFESVDLPKGDMINIIWRHIIPKIIPSNALNENEIFVGTLETPNILSETPLGLKNIDGDIEINYKDNIIKSVSVDTMASDGVIHTVDNLILPAITTTTETTTTGNH